MTRTSANRLQDTISFSRMQRKDETAMYPSWHSGVCSAENKSESPIARVDRPRRAASRRDTPSIHGESPGERKVYITEEFDSTSGTWPRPLSYLSKYACSTGWYATAYACSYYSFLRNWRSCVSTDHPRLSGRFPPTWSAVSSNVDILRLPALCGGQDKIINFSRSTFAFFSF